MEKDTVTDDSVVNVAKMLKFRTIYQLEIVEIKSV